MGTRNLFPIKTQFDFLVNNSSSAYGNMYRVVSSTWVFVCTYLFYVFGSIFRRISRFKHGEDDHGTGSGCCQVSEIDKGNGATKNFVVKETASSASGSKYEFLCGGGVSGFIEEPKALSFTIHEGFSDSKDETVTNPPCIDSGGSCEKNFEDPDVETKDFVEEKTEETREFVQGFVIDEVLETQEGEHFTKKNISDERKTVADSGYGDGDLIKEAFGNHELILEACVAEKAEETLDSVEKLVIEEDFKKQEPELPMHERGFKEKEMVGLEDRFVGNHDLSNEIQLLSKSNAFPCEAKQEPLCSSEEFSGNKDEINSITYELSDSSNVIEECEHQSPVWTDDEENSEPGAVFTRHQSAESDDDYIELEPQKQNSVLLDAELFSGEDLRKDLDEEKKDSAVSSDVEDYKDYLLLDHEDIIAQLKMELKHARTGGLPTILEEPETEEESEQSETPKIMQDLKPLKIAEKFEHKDYMDEIQNVYKSYSEKMRKLDVLNFQAMHALGLHQLKDTFQSQMARKYSLPSMKHLLMQTLWSCKPASAAINPTDKVIADVHRDFELVYVGQLCLSWEMLHWQYRRVQELQKYEGSHQYNQTASEFQLFQVLLQRFMENEQFQGPRVQNYVNYRCVLRNLLQIPSIKDDNLIDKSKGGDNNDTVTSQMLTKIIHEAIRELWEFIRADKDERNVLPANDRTYVHLNNSVDMGILINTQMDLQKKEKKLKDIIRSGNCIMKRFKKQNEDRVNPMLLITQVELKLVSRVINMCKLTRDQLMWCHEKLDRIRFGGGREVFVEPSFLLFPC